jgi:serine/threonine-protein kinase HipA
MARTDAVLAVYLNRTLVGLLTQSSSGEVTFTYDGTWLKNPGTMPISLSLPLGEKPLRGRAVLAYFDNLLPDNEEIRRRIAEREGAASTRPFDLLASIGRDCVGALRFLPADADPDRVSEMVSHELTEADLAHRLRRLKETPLGREAEDEDFRISIAGAQDKTAFLKLPSGAWAIPGGLTPTSHIFKPPIGKTGGGSLDLSDSVENEWMSLALCQALGLPVAHATIETFENVKALVVTRFDRIETKGGLRRIPQEDLCQALATPSTMKYEEQGGPGMIGILKFLAASDSPDEDRSRFLRAQIIFWLMSAPDGHAKNFSVFLTPGGFSLTPIYDVMTSLPYAPQGRIFDSKQVKLAMAVGRNRHYRMEEIAPRHWKQTADAAGLPKGMAETVMADLAERADAALDQVSALLPAEFPIRIFETTRDMIVRRAHELRP